MIIVHKEHPRIQIMTQRLKYQVPMIEECSSDKDNKFYINYKIILFQFNLAQE